MEGLTLLLEYRPGRYAWADPETGQVIRKATDEEADAELARRVGLETLPLVALNAGDPTCYRTNDVSGRGGHTSRPEVGSEMPGGQERVARSPTADPEPMATDMAPGQNGDGFWLWVYGPGKGGDLLSHLQRAMALFASKPTWSGQRPAMIRAHPVDTGNGLGPAAEALGLQVVSDRLCPPETFRLGLGDGEGGDRVEAV